MALNRIHHELELRPHQLTLVNALTISILIGVVLHSFAAFAEPKWLSPEEKTWCWKKFSGLVPQDDITSDLLFKAFSGIQRQIRSGKNEVSAEDKLALELNDLSYHFAQAYETIVSIPASVFQGKETPDFGTVTAFMSARHHLYEGLSELQAKGKLSRIWRVIGRLKEEFPKFQNQAYDPDIKKLFDDPHATEAFKYLNSRHFEAEVIRINRILPPELRLPVPHFPYK